MSSRLPDVPTVPSGLDRGLRDILQSLRENVRAMRGFTPGGVSAIGSGTGGGVIGTGGGVTVTGVGTSSEPDLTAPPSPSGVSVIAGIDFVGIQTDEPVFTQGHGYGRTIVFGAKYPGTGPLPTFSDAVVVHEFVGSVGTFATDPSTQWHIWLEWRSIDGVDSLPEGGTNGHQVTTGQDVSLLLEALTGEITRNEIAADVWRTGTFAIAPPAGSPLPSILPFVVQTTSVTVNGVTFPAGVYIDQAFINDLTAPIARLGSLWVTNAMVASLSASKLTAGSVGVSDYIQSTGYVSGSAGWRISGNGALEMNTGTFRGALAAASGSFRGSVSGGAISSWAWPAAGSGPGFYLGPNGLLMGNANEGQWVEIVSDGTFSMPGMSVSGGVLTISQANVINTLNVATNAITAPAGARLTAGTNLPASTLTTLLSIMLDPAGSPVFVFAQLQVRATAARSGGSNVTAILDVPGGTSTSSDKKTDGMAINDTETITLSVYDTRTSLGSRTYNLQANQFGTGSIEAAATQTTIFGLGTKR